MDYIVLDLEWNQSPEGKEFSEKLLPFEIIEIGAVKLDDQLNMIDSFQAVIKPQVYKQLHHKTSEIINIDSTTLSSGRLFPEVVNEFFVWCGQYYRFCTWGALDLTELQRNLNYYGLGSKLMGPFKYYDVQKIFSIKYEDRKNRRNLQSAVEFLQITKDQSFHRAYYDAYYTAQVLQHFKPEDLERNYSMDYYRNPQKREDELYLLYDTYEKYVSMEFETKEDVMEDIVVTSTICYKCKKPAKKKFQWFSANNNIYYSIAYCKQHGYLRGKLRMKKTDTGRFFGVKTLKLIEWDEAAKIKEKKNMIQLKRRLKRHSHDEGHQD